LVILLVILGVGAAGFIGYALGDKSRDDEVESAEASSAKAEKALAEEQAQDDEALQKLSQGLQQLGGAITAQDAQDDQATQAAVDQAVDEVRAGLEQFGTEARADVERAVSDLSERINEAVGSGGTGNAPDGGG
jgi:F0F1-type ATP synthase membrane subunit b/b'